MIHPRRDLRAVFSWSLLIATVCALLSCRVDDYGNPAYRRGDACATRLYRGFCEEPPRHDAAADMIVDSGADQPSEPSRQGEPCAREREEALCYDAPDRTRAVGACISGVAKCVEGRWSECYGQVLPIDDTCNGGDDDCDGHTDEGLSGDCVASSNGCAGHLSCKRGHMACEAIADPMPETCNALDDDCDGDIDEDSDRPCVGGNGGCVAHEDGDIACKGVCTPGVQRCRAGMLEDACGEQKKPAERERCDEDAAGVDDDCDGEADEGCPCKGAASRACYSVSAQERDAGECMPGKQICTDGTWGTCTGAGKPSAEACPGDGIDNDCNGKVDDVRGSGKHCVSSRPGRCRDGAQQCVGDELRCVTPSEAPETCNEIDDDCDGETDEKFDLLNDRAHCGDCNTACDDDDVCCSGECVDTRADDDHCSSCNYQCGSNLSCCDSFCTAMNFDRDNCGACGNVCDAEEVCCLGACVDTMNDAQHCGGCAMPCEHGCAAGECLPM